MKRTEIIIETRRIVVIRRRQSNQSRDGAGLANTRVIDIAHANDRPATDEGFGNDGIQGAENEPCTDSRDL